MKRFPMRYRLLGPVIMAGLLLLLAGCSQERPWNVVLVTFDTTRADRIGCYGNDRIRTPALDGLAADGIRFANAVSVAPITAPSHASILTGLYPTAHGFRDNGLFVLNEGNVTLAEMLRDRGYATAAAVGAFPVVSQFGFDQGFDLFDDHLTGLYEDYLGERAVPKDELFFDERRAWPRQLKSGTALADDCLRRGAMGDTPFFFSVGVHYFLKSGGHIKAQHSNPPTAIGTSSYGVIEFCTTARDCVYTVFAARFNLH